jgi:hypothetical protein
VAELLGRRRHVCRHSRRGGGGGQRRAVFCDHLAEGFRTLEDTPFSAVSCQVIDDVCTCDAAQTESLDASVASGVQYSIESNSLLTSGGQRSFCVEEDVLVPQLPEPLFGVSGIRYRLAR